MADRDRLEREINEILQQIGDVLPSPPHKLPHRLQGPADSLSAWERARVRALGRVSPVHLLLASFVLLCLGFALDELLPYEGYWLTLLGALLFVPAFALVVFRRRRGKGSGHRLRSR